MSIFTVKEKPLNKVQRVLRSEATQMLIQSVARAMAIRAAIPKILEKGLNLLLAHLPGYRGHIGKIEFTLLRSQFQIQQFILRTKENDQEKPFVTVDQVTVNLHWKALFSKALIADMEIVRPVLYLDTRRLPEFAKSVQAFAHAGLRRLRDTTPFRLSRVRIRGGAIHLRHPLPRGPIHLAFTDIALDFQNVTNTTRYSPRMDTVLEGYATLPGKGRLSLGGTVYPFSGSTPFDLTLHAVGIGLPALNPLLHASLGIESEQGTLAFAAEIAAGQGGLRGYVKPVLENLSLKTAHHSGWLGGIRASIIRLLAHVFRNKQTDSLATRIPFQSDFHDVEVDYGPALTALWKHAFQTALHPSVDNSIGFAWSGPRDAVIDYPAIKKPRTRLHHFLSMLKESASRWSRDEAMRLSAALAYYTSFSIAPLLILVIAIAALVFGRKAAEGAIGDQLASLMGQSNAATIQTMIAAAWNPAKGILATGIGLVSLLLGAVGVLTELKDALNSIWHYTPPDGFSNVIKKRLVALGLILGVGFLMIVSLVVSAGLAAFGKYMSGALPLPIQVMQTLNFFVSLAIITVLFAFIYKWLPDAAVSWSDVWVGAAVTSLLFTIGKSALGLYLGKSAAGSYGAAGSVLIMLLWTYYSAMIFYLGSEFTVVYAERHGSRRLLS